MHAAPPTVLAGPCKLPVGGRVCVDIGRPGGAMRYFDGTIDEINIYDRALSVSEVSELAKTGVIANDTDADAEGLFASLVAGPASG